MIVYSRPGGKLSPFITERGVTGKQEEGAIDERQISTDQISGDNLFALICTPEDNNLRRRRNTFGGKATTSIG